MVDGIAIMNIEIMSGGVTKPANKNITAIPKSNTLNNFFEGCFNP